MTNAMYITDDRDYPQEDQRALVISMGGNGDWYVQVTGVNGRSTEGVRLCTSGGASTNVPGLTGAIAEAYRCIIAAQTNEKRTHLMSESYCKLQTEVKAWRDKFPNLRFHDEVFGFSEDENESEVVAHQRFSEEKHWIAVNAEDIEHYKNKGQLIRELIVKA